LAEKKRNKKSAACRIFPCLTGHPGREFGASNKISNRINSLEHYWIILVFWLSIIYYLINSSLAQTVFVLRYFINAPNGKKLKVGPLLKKDRPIN